MNYCPSIQTLEMYLRNQLAIDELSALELHVETCDHCDARLERLSDGIEDWHSTHSSEERATPTASQNLLFGMLALHNGFISRDEFVSASGQWLEDKARPLEVVLLERQVISEDERSLISALVKKHAEPSQVSIERLLQGTFELPGKRHPRRQYYHVAVDMTIQTADVHQQSRLSYELELECAPLKNDKTKSIGQRVAYTCRRFTVRRDGAEPTTIPSLKDWSYEFTYPSRDVAPNGNVFGLPNSKFNGLTLSDGGRLDAQLEFLAYNAFTDFHVICNVYAQEMQDGAGIQALRNIGDRILHGSSQLRAPLGDMPGLVEGSEFVHGNVTLAFEGIGLQHGRPCALIGFDAPENTFKMVVEPAPSCTVVSQGESHHTGNLSIDLGSGWVTKAQLTETVVSWVNVRGRQTGPSVIRRSLRLRLT